MRPTGTTASQPPSGLGYRWLARGTSRGGHPRPVLEPVPDRSLEAPRQNGPRQEQIAGRAALQARVSFLQALGLVHVQNVGRERDGLLGEGIRHANVRVRV